MQGHDELIVQPDSRGIHREAIKCLEDLFVGRIRQLAVADQTSKSAGIEIGRCTLEMLMPAMPNVSSSRPHFFPEIERPAAASTKKFSAWLSHPHGVCLPKEKTP